MAKPTPIMDFYYDFPNKYKIFKQRGHRLAVARYCLKSQLYDVYTAYMCITYMQFNLGNKSEEDYSRAYLAFVRVFLREKDKSRGIHGAPYELNLNTELRTPLVDYEKSYPQNNMTIRELDDALDPIKKELVRDLKENLFGLEAFKTIYFNKKRYANNKLGKELKKYKLSDTPILIQNLHRNVRETLDLAGFPINYIFPKGLL